MGALFKTVLVATPALALVIYLALSWQTEVRQDLRKDDAVFDRAWAEWELPPDPARARERVEKAEAELAKIEAEKAEAKARREREMAEIRAVLDGEKEGQK